MRIKWFSLVRVTGLLLVLLYHYFQKAFPGGFIGVDIFFTFSGFLITALLIDEFARKQGIDYLAFLKRRFYRIVPPLVFMVLVVMPFTFMVQRDYVAGIGTQIAAVFGFVTNFFEMATGGSYESNFIPGQDGWKIPRHALLSIQRALSFYLLVHVHPRLSDS